RRIPGPGAADPPHRHGNPAGVGAELGTTTRTSGVTMSIDQGGFLSGGWPGRVDRRSSAGSAAAQPANDSTGGGGSVVGDDDIVVSIIEDHPMFRRVLADVVSAAPGMRL